MYAYDYLVKARHDDLLRAAAQHRLAAQARQGRPARRHHAMAAPVRRLSVMRLRRLFS
jgi:hypothetical protein